MFDISYLYVICFIVGLFFSIFFLLSLKVEESQIIEDLTHPSVTSDPEYVKSRISIYKDAYSATKGTHAIVLCTEWDEFVVSNNVLLA